MPLMRKRIEAAQIQDRLIEHVLSTEENGTMSASQVSAATTLLKKVLPDLSAQEVTGKGGESLFTSVLREVIDAKAKD